MERVVLVVLGSWQGSAPAAGVRVVLDDHSEALVQSRASVRSQGRKILVFYIPAAAVVVFVGLYGLAQSAKTDPASFVVGILAAAVIIGGPSWFWLRRQKARSTKYPGRIWSSAAAFYEGPFDDEHGFVGSKRFSRRHRANTLRPVVRLILTERSIEVMPSRGRRETLSCSYSDIDTVEVSTERKAHGVNLLLRNKRRASFLFRPDAGLVEALRRLGASIQKRGPT